LQSLPLDTWQKTDTRSTVSHATVLDILFCLCCLCWISKKDGLNRNEKRQKHTLLVSKVSGRYQRYQKRQGRQADCTQSSRQSDRTWIEETFQMKWSTCYPYTLNNVRIYAPTSRGIYRLLIKNRIFYIGQSENLQNRLLEHRQAREGNRRLKKYLQNYSCFFRFTELDTASDLSQTERDQILKYKPFCNVALHPPVVGRWRKPLPNC